MRNAVKSSLKRLIDLFVALMGTNSIGRYLYAKIVADAMEKTQSVIHQDVQLRFSVPNALCKYRADTFSTKEPETLEWIDGMPQGSIVWDIGANVGLYSCYAAKRRGCTVFAFEPSVFNLELLARNIFLNGLTEQVTIVPLPLSGMLAVNKLNMSSTNWGGALSTFGQSYGHDGQPMQKIFEFRTIGLSMADAAQHLNITPPDYVKMDVDGIEHLILRGGMPIMSSVKGILVEINEQFTAQAHDATACLHEAGFSLKEKRQAESQSTGPAQYTFNQIWVR